MLVVVGGDRRDGRLLHLLDRRIDTLLLIDTDVVVVEILVGEGYDLGLGHLGDAVDLAHGLLPILAVDEGIDVGVGAELVALQLLVEVALHVVDHRGQ